MRRRFASDYNNSARAVRVPRTVAPIQRDRSAYLLVVNTRQGYHLNFFFFMFVERELVVEEEFKYRAYRSRSSLVQALIQATTVTKIYTEWKTTMNTNGHISNSFLFFKLCMCKEDTFKIFTDFNDRKLLNDLHLLRTKTTFQKMHNVQYEI